MKKKVQLGVVHRARKCHFKIINLKDMNAGEWLGS